MTEQVQDMEEEESSVEEEEGEMNFDTLPEKEEQQKPKRINIIQQINEEIGEDELL